MLPFLVVGYLVMPEHFHPGQRGRAGPALAKTATGMVATPFAGFERWEHEPERVFIRHILAAQHCTDVSAGQWKWSDYRYYAYGESGTVLIHEPRRAELRVSAPK